MMSRIERVHAREVFDSRGRPTVEVDVICHGNFRGRAIVPSGASTGRFEACELRDGDAGRLNGLGVTRAVKNVCTEIQDAVVDLPAEDQAQIDRTLCELDGTPNKSRLGANAILGTSLAVSRAAAAAQECDYDEWLGRLWHTHWSHRPEPLPLTPGYGPTLPLLMVNMISGGLHAGGNLDFQDFLLLPVGASSYRQSFDWIVAVYHELGRQLQGDGLEGRLVGDEGGYGPRLPNNEAALDYLIRSIEACRLSPGKDLAIGLDVASSHFYESGRYTLKSENRTLDSAAMVDELERWVDTYPIVSIEDGLAEDDWDGWKLLTRRLGSRVQLIGDDLFVTNPQRLRRGIESGVANSILIKVNQIGTLTESLTAMAQSIQAGYWPVVSARSGETEDTTIAELVVATGAGQLKVGSVARSERLSKYNQLLRLEEKLGRDARFAGGQIFDKLDARRSASARNID